MGNIKKAKLIEFEEYLAKFCKALELGVKKRKLDEKERKRLAKKAKKLSLIKGGKQDA